MIFLRSFLLIILTGWLWHPVVAARGLKANVAVKKLTPPLELGYTLGGYGARMSKPAEGIHDDIWTKALVLDDGQKKFAIVTLDILGLPPNVKPRVIEILNDNTWTEENILFLPSHAHTSLEMFSLNDKNIFNMAPIGIFQPKLLEFVVNTLADVIREADYDLEPVKVGTADIQLQDLNRNRRGSPFVDKTLTVTRIDQMDDQPLTVLVNWTAHPTIMDENDMLVSAGWPGYLQRELEGLIGKGIVAMYYNGAEGDQSVIAKSGGSHYETAERYGRTIATKVLSVYHEIKPNANPILGYNYKVIKLPEKMPHPQFMETGGKEYGLDENKIQILLDQVFPSETSIAACRIGDLLIAGAPGELIAELGLSVKDQLKQEGIQHPVIGGLANQWISYILTTEEYEKGGYETSTSFYGKDLGNIITSAMLETANPLTHKK